MNIIKILIFILVLNLSSYFAKAQVLEQIDAKNYILKVNDQPQIGMKYFSLNNEGKKVGLFVVKNIETNGDVSVELTKGKTEVGAKVTSANSGDEAPSQQNSASQKFTSKGKKQPIKKSTQSSSRVSKYLLSFHGLYLTGSGTLTVSAGSESASTSANISGFGAGTYFDTWMGNLSLGGEFLISSLSVSSTGYSSSTTVQEIGGCAGYLLTPNLHLKSTLYIYSSTTSGMAGFGVSGRYFIGKNLGILAQYRTFVATPSNTDGIKMTVSTNMIGIGASYLLSF